MEFYKKNLILQRKFEEDQKEKKKMLKQDGGGGGGDSDSEEEIEECSETESSPGVLDLFRTPNLCRKTLIITFIW